MVTVEFRGIAKLERDLKTFARRAYPFATRNTVNLAAFAAQKVARERIAADMVLKNRFTERSIRVEKAKTLRVENQMAVVGSTADYMEVQEFGGVITSKVGEGVPIPTSYSAGQGEKRKPRTRLPRLANRRSRIRLSRGGNKATSRKQRNFIAIRQAADSGNKFVYLDLGRRRGIFKVLGKGKRARIKMVHDLSRRSVIIPASPWLAPSVEAVRPLIPEMYLKSLEFQARRQGLFR